MACGGRLSLAAIAVLAGLLVVGACAPAAEAPGVLQRLDEIASAREARLAELGGPAEFTREESRWSRRVWSERVTTRRDGVDNTEWVPGVLEVNGAAGRLMLWLDGVAAAPFVRDGDRFVAVGGDRTWEFEMTESGLQLAQPIEELARLDVGFPLAPAYSQTYRDLIPDSPDPALGWPEWIGHYVHVGPDGGERTIVLHERRYRPAFEIDGLVLAFGEWTLEGFALDPNPLEIEAVGVRRDAAGQPEALVLSETVWRRVGVGTEEGVTFRIEPVAPIGELREAALEAEPPAEPADLAEPDLVELTTVEPGIRLDVRYAGSNNFMGVPFYRQARAFLQRPAAEAVGEVHRRLARYGLGLLVHDGYRPWYVTKMFWDATPEELREFVADPSQGSRHNRGAAVDLTLVDLETGEPVRMTGGYDEFSVRSYPDYPGGTTRQRWFRELLREEMERAGFSVYEAEWWHFDFDGWERWPILDRTFEELQQGGTLEE